MTDLISLLGYSKGSPYASNPYLDIHTPEGLIDMSNTPIDLIGIDNKGNKKKMKAGNKNPYQFEGHVVREIPIKQLGGFYNYIMDDDEEEEDDRKKPVKKVEAPSVEEVAPVEQPNEYDDAMAIAMGDDDMVPTTGNPYAAQAMGASMAPETNPYKAGQYGQQIIGDLINNLGYTPQFNSVFRTPEKQAQLIKQGFGVKNSWHLSGDAVDLKPADWNNLGKEKQQYFRSNYDVVYHNNHYHLEPKGSPARAANTEKAKYAFDFFTSKGLPAHAAAGVVGNLIQESGNFRDDVIAGTKKGDNGFATGIAQWHGARRKALEQWSEQNGFNPYTLDAQLQFVYHEATQRGDIQALSSSRSPEDAAYIFAKRYERPKIIDQYRINYAKNIYNAK